MQRYVRTKSKIPYAVRIFIYIIAACMLLFLLLEIGVLSLHYKEPYKPDYKKEDLSSIIYKDKLSDKDYDTLLLQTGVTKAGVDAIISANGRSDLLKIQEDFFAHYPVKKIQFSPITCCHEVEKHITTVPLEDGDIIITPTSHFSFFEMGHSALVVDSFEGTIMNATGYDNISCFEDIGEATNRPIFMVLRLKADKETRAKIAKNAKEKLLDLKYSISIGVIGKKYVENPMRTNCSHLIWHTFKTFGFDIDSNGGGVVLPMDFFESENLEILQVYGYDAAKMKKQSSF